MAKVILAARNLITASGLTITGSSEAASMPDDNIAVEHPSEPWRITTLSGANVVIDLVEPTQWDVAALICTTATPHRNLVLRSGDFSHATWTKTNITATLSNVAGSVIPGVVTPTWDLTASGAGNLERSTEQLVVEPSGSQQYTASVYVRRQDGNGGHVRLTAEGQYYPNTDYAWSNFNLTTGAAAANSDNGNITLDGSSITSLGSGWYRISITFTSIGDSATNIVINLLNSAFNDTFVLGSGADLMVAAPQVELGATAGDAAKTTTAQGSHWQVQGHQADSWGSPNTDSDLLALPLSSDLVDWKSDVGFIHALYRPTTAVNQRYVRIRFFDDNNLDGTLDIGTVFLGREFQPTYGFAPDSLDIGWVENADTSEAAGGQEYRSIGAVKRVASFSLMALSKAEAWGDIMALRRHAGMSLPVIVMLDPDETSYGQEMMVYGFLNDAGPINSRGRDYYSHGFTVTEVLP
jgi:hypothetical protein